MRQWREGHLRIHSPDSNRRMPLPVSARALTPPELGTSSLIYPPSMRRSRWLSGMVRSIGLVPNSLKEANSSRVSRSLYFLRTGNRAMPLSMRSAVCHKQADTGTGNVARHRLAGGMSVLGQSRPNRSAAKPAFVRCWSNSDHSRHEPELTLSATI